MGSSCPVEAFTPSSSAASFLCPRCRGVASGLAVSFLPHRQAFPCARRTAIWVVGRAVVSPWLRPMCRKGRRVASCGGAGELGCLVLRHLGAGFVRAVVGCSLRGVWFCFARLQRQARVVERVANGAANVRLRMCPRRNPRTLFIATHCPQHSQAQREYSVAVLPERRSSR